MQARIKSIKLKYTKDHQPYLIATIYDEQEKFIGTFGSEKISDPINFRTFLFGLMTSSNCFDLLRLSSDKPKEKEIEYYHFDNDNKIIINQKNQALMKHKNGTYICQPLDPRFKRLCELTGIPKRQGHITHIKSASGVFMIGIQGQLFYTNFVTNQIYYGFSYLWGQRDYNQEDILLASTFYTSFIESILKLYNTNDILKLNGKPEKFPKINAILNKSGEIVALQNTDLTFTLYEQNQEYFVSNNPNLDLTELTSQEKPKSLLKKIIKWRLQ